jgi:hypothetical protein
MPFSVRHSTLPTPPLDLLFLLWIDSGSPKHPTQVDHHLLIDIRASRGVERLGLTSQCHLVSAIVTLSDFGHAAQEGQDIVPLDVVTDGMLEDLPHRRPMMPVELDALSHVVLLNLSDQPVTALASVDVVTEILDAGDLGLLRHLFAIASSGMMG